MTLLASACYEEADSAVVEDTQTPALGSTSGGVSTASFTTGPDGSTTAVGGTEGPTSGPTSTGDPPEESGTTDASGPGSTTTAETGDTESGETTTQPTDTVSVSGRVRQGGLFTEPPLPDAVVSLWGDPSVSTVADENGDFELTNVPANSTVHLVATHPDYRPGINSLETGSEDATQFGMPMISLAVLEAAGPAFPNADLSLGSVFFVSSHVDTTINAVAGGISLMQPGLYYSNDVGVLSFDDNVTHLPEYPVIGVLNVPDSAPGSMIVTATHPTLDCAPNPLETTPVAGGHSTTLFILCS